MMEVVTEGDFLQVLADVIEELLAFLLRAATAVTGLHFVQN